jgi:hypothetical protein
MADISIMITIQFVLSVSSNSAFLIQCEKHLHGHLNGIIDDITASKSVL